MLLIDCHYQISDLTWTLCQIAKTTQIYREATACLIWINRRRRPIQYYEELLAETPYGAQNTFTNSRQCVCVMPYEFNVQYYIVGKGVLNPTPMFKSALGLIRLFDDEVKLL